MSNESQRIVMLIGSSYEARSKFAASLKQLGWRVAGDSVSPLAGVQQLLESLKEGKEVVINKRNLSPSERSRWFITVRDRLKDSVQVRWIGLVMEDTSQARSGNQKGAKIHAGNGSSSLQIKKKEGFEKILFLRDLQPNPEGYFGQSFRSVSTNGFGQRRITPSDYADPFQWKAEHHCRQIKNGELVLLFDLNGTLTSHTASRKSTGRTRLRPGTEHLLRLKGHFRLGIFTSSTIRTVDKVLSIFRDALGEHLFDPDLIFFRNHTLPVGRHLVNGHGLKPWDTVKPLNGLFSDLRRVVLFDDDHWKAVRGEESNMVIVPCWASEDPRDRLIENLVRHILAFFGGLSENADVRNLTGNLTSILNHEQAVSGEESNILPMQRLKEQGSRKKKKMSKNDSAEKKPRDFNSYKL